MARPAPGVFVAFFVPETALVDLQQWRGVPSHFNRATEFDGLVFSVMGVLILVIGNEPSSTSLANASIDGAAGQLKVPHALALHGLQVMGVLAVLLERSKLTEGARTLAVAACAVGYALLLVAESLLTVAGVGPLAFTPPALVLGAVGALMVAAAYLRGVVSFAGPARA